MKIVVITCYADPDLWRIRLLRAAVKSLTGVKLIVVKNRYKSWLRYPEVLWKLRRVKRQRHPDAYLLTFRGQEILPFVLRTAGSSPVWFDEFVVPLAYASDEDPERPAGKKRKQRLVSIGFVQYKRWLHRCKAIFAGSAEQAELSARLSHMNLSRYLVLPNEESTDEPSPASVSTAARLIQSLIDEIA